MEEIDRFTGDIGAVKDQHVSAGKISSRKGLQDDARNDGWSWSETLAYYNSGVMFVKDSDLTHKFYQTWHNKWVDKQAKTGYYKDQSFLAATNESFQYPMRELPGEWNCQFFRNGVIYLAKAKIMHYLLYGLCSHPWIFYNQDILNEIKELGYIPERTSKIVDEAKCSFIVPNMIISGTELLYFNSDLFEICKNRRIFSLFNLCAIFLLKIRSIVHFFKS